MNITRRFIQALEALERDWEIDELVALFSDECEVGNVVSPNAFVGRQGARDYWSVYRRWFAEIESTIHRVIYSERHSAIEWSSRGTSAKGRLISYEGVTILEFEDDRISRYRAYFNPAHLSRGVRHAHALSDAYEAAFS
jgi:ketosteroid isomerase-like protein